MKSSNVSKSKIELKNVENFEDLLSEESTKAWMHRMIKEEREYVKNLKVVRDVINFFFFYLNKARVIDFISLVDLFEQYFARSISLH